MTNQPTKEQLDRAIENFTKKAQERVSRIPLEQLIIVTLAEAREIQKMREEKNAPKLADQTVRRRRWEIEETIEKIREAAEESVKLKLAELKELHNRCSHSDVSFHGDPSGNNDSHRECEICGKIL